VTLNNGGTQFIVLFDAKTHLPAAIRTMDDDNIYGDSTFDAVLGDWKDVGGVKIAHALSYQVNGVEVSKVTYKEVAANPSIAADAFNVPMHQVSPKAPATATCPINGHSRLMMSRFLDAIRSLPPGGSLKLVGDAERTARTGRRRQQPDRRHEGSLVVFDAVWWLQS
jgi:hypothetical protein